MKIADLEFNVRIAGRGPDVVWSHGLLSSMEAEDALGWMGWEDFPRHVRLVRYDARGHGRSAGTAESEDYEYRQLARDMLAVARAAGAERFVAGGSSMGCATALHAALAAPSRIKALILMNPGTAWETRPAQAHMLERAAAAGAVLGGQAMAGIMDKTISRSMPAWLVRAEPEKSELYTMGMRTVGKQTLRAIFQGAAHSDLPAKLAITRLADIPVIIFGWDGDPTHPVSTAQELHLLLPRSELFIARGYEQFQSIPARLREFVEMYA